MVDKLVEGAYIPTMKNARFEGRCPVKTRPRKEDIGEDLRVACPLCGMRVSLTFRGGKVGFAIHGHRADLERRERQR